MPYSDQDHDRALARLLRDIENTPPPRRSPAGLGLCLFILGVVLAFAVLLAVGCNTVAGVGQDLQDAARGIQNEWAADDEPSCDEDPHADLWRAICQVESGGNPDAHNPGEDARGIAQIRAIMVKDVNRIAGTSYRHDDAYDPEKAREMFDIYCTHYHPHGTAEQLARAWNGGPKGPSKPSTLGYWRKVQKVLDGGR